jgi:thioredoxin-dependent peroxiredoxin
MSSKSKELEEGNPAPDFHLKSDDGNTYSLSQFKGKKEVLLYFYPKDDTPGCTKEACGFRDSFDHYARAGAKVIGVSPDSVESHTKFARKFELPFLLLADPDHKVCEAYGVWKEKNMYGKKYMGVERSTFLVDSKGILREEWRKVKVNGHAEAVLNAVKAL